MSLIKKKTDCLHALHHLRNVTPPQPLVVVVVVVAAVVVVQSVLLSHLICSSLTESVVGVVESSVSHLCVRLSGWLNASVTPSLASS